MSISPLEVKIDGATEFSDEELAELRSYREHHDVYLSALWALYCGHYEKAGDFVRYMEMQIQRLELYNAKDEQHTQAERVLLLAVLECWTGQVEASDRIVKFILRCAKSERFGTRLNSTHALFKLAEKGASIAINTLAHLANDEHERVRNNAEIFVKRIEERS